MTCLLKWIFFLLMKEKTEQKKNQYIPKGGI